MRQPFDAISPVPHYYKVHGRAAEIARSFGCRACGPEHLFLGMVHDGGWPMTAIKDLLDLDAAEAAVLGLINSPGYTPPPPPRFPQQDGYLPPWGADVAFEMGDSYHGLEHALLSLLRHRDGVPARALTGLADLDALEAAVLAAKNAESAGPPANAVFLPEGREMDRPLRRAIIAALPEETTFGFSSDGSGRTWVHVFGAGEAADDALTRQVLNAALSSIDRPTLG